MKSLKWIILVLPLLMVGLPTVFAQSDDTNLTNNTGGLSSESVDAAITNSTSSPANLTVNSSSQGDTQNNTGGLSSESVDAAITNSTSSPANLTVNSSSQGDTQNNTGGLSSESVTESKY